MNFREYQELTRRTANRSDPEVVLNFALGLAGETGELLELIKKARFHRKPFRIDDAKKEAGDVLWYLAALIDALGFDMEDVAKTNIEKLRQRYPNKFEFGGGNREPVPIADPTPHPTGAEL